MSATKNPRKVIYIIIHCSATPNGDARFNARAIDQWHRERGWKMIGYHYVIEVDGFISDGRPEQMVGAHTSGVNETSIGVCMIGTDKFTLNQWRALKVLCEDLLERYDDVVILGHRDLSPDMDGDGVILKHEWVKTCPGFDVRAWLLEGVHPHQVYASS